MPLPRLAAALFTHSHKLDTPWKWFSMQAAGCCVWRVYLGDLNPAGTGELLGSHSRSWGPTAAEIARPCRRRPCRWPWEMTGWLLAAPSFPSARRSSQRLVVGADSLRSSSSSSPADGSLERGGAPRWSTPLSDMAPGMGRVYAGAHWRNFFYFFLINCIDLKSVFHLIPQIHIYSYLSLRIITTWLKSKRDDKVWEFKWWDKKKQQLTAVATRCHCGITEVRGSAVRARSPHILLFIHGCGVRFTQQSPAVLCFLCRPGVANSFYNMEDHEYQN